jgi:hypothetical protein
MGSTDVLPALVEAAPDVSLLELLQNSNVGSGLQTAVPSRRGATTHALHEGGVQEKELVEKQFGASGWRDVARAATRRSRL